MSRLRRSVTQVQYSTRVQEMASGLKRHQQKHKSMDRFVLTRQQLFGFWSFFDL
jgi:hypothetical protein